MEKSARIRISIQGAVQGVGFRPFVYRLARDLGLNGWVLNSSGGLRIEAEGPKELLDRFLIYLTREHPRHASIHSLEYSFLDTAGYTTFEIRHSDKQGTKRALIVPDIATCKDCLAEIFDRSNSRYLYPFTNCTHCGPRFTILESIPYDRANTTMRHFRMCARCTSEYQDPLDRRFHAQPNACPECGPQLEAWDVSGATIGRRDEALRRSVEALREGRIVAVKGLGGFHLMVDARNDDAVRRLRARKRREDKPFALMAASLESVGEMCLVDILEERILTAPEAPIVILSRREPSKIAESVAPRNPYLGVMLPFTPLHHILMRELGSPVVATSGNRTDETLAIHEVDALHRLQGIADLFLVHNRPIRRHADDSIVRIVLGREQVLRRARGYAPLPIPIAHSLPAAIAVGGQLKNTVALASGTQVFISQHIGNLETKEAVEAFHRVINDLGTLYGFSPECLAGDLHPDFVSTIQGAKLAAAAAVPFKPVQHHWAHVLSCMADNGVGAPALGVAWDGTGYGADQTIWGGEFLLASHHDFRRVAHLRTFPLPGGDAAARKPRQAALGLLYEIFGDDTFTGSEPELLRQMLSRGIRSPRTSSAGRLFDAVAWLVEKRDSVSFEGQAAMELEFAAASGIEDSYEFAIRHSDPFVIDWEPMIRQIITEVKDGEETGKIAAKFHNTLAEMIVDISRRIGQQKVLLSGGCFQNRYLTERTVHRLNQAGFSAYWHQRVPPNDGGLALGQAVAMKAIFQQREEVCVLRSQAR